MEGGDTDTQGLCSLCCLGLFVGGLAKRMEGIELHHNCVVKLSCNCSHFAVICTLHNLLFDVFCRLDKARVCDTKTCWVDSWREQHLLSE